MRAGYCYGKRIMWVDKLSFSTLWADVYDREMKLVKILMSEKIAAPVGQQGIQFNTGNNVETVWDIRSGHLTNWLTSGSGAKGLVNQQACRNLNGVNYDDIQQYCTVGGLTQIMR